MERADLLSLVAGLIIVVVIALVVKPMIADGPGNTLSPDNGTAQVMPTVTPIPESSPTPSPTPSWDGKVHEIGFVDPTTYHLNSTTSDPITMGVFPSRNSSSNTMVTYATVHGTGSGTTEIIHIPTPYWELRYDVDPYNTDFGYFNVQVMDATDPNRFVRIVTLQRSDLVQGEEATAKWKKENWKETFYEGQKDYWFVINTQCIRSYTLQIMVPEKYVSQTPQ